MYKNLARELKKNIEIMENTFEVNNLQIMNVSVQPYNREDADCDVYVEVAAIKGCKIRNSIDIKINLYDENDELFLVNSRYIDKDTFNGYDTLHIKCYKDKSTLQHVIRGRLYAVR